MKISARNRLKGTITEIVKGATTAHVRIDIGNGIVVTSSITNEVECSPFHRTSRLV